MLCMADVHLGIKVSSQLICHIKSSPLTVHFIISYLLSLLNIRPPLLLIVSPIIPLIFSYSRYSVVVSSIFQYWGANQNASHFQGAGFTVSLSHLGDPQPLVWCSPAFISILAKTSQMDWTMPNSLYHPPTPIEASQNDSTYCKSTFWLDFTGLCK